MDNLTMSFPPDFTKQIQAFIKEEIAAKLEELKYQQSEKPFMTTREVQVMLGVSYMTLKKLEERGLKPFKLDRKVLYEREQVLKVMRGELDD